MLAAQVRWRVRTGGRWEEASAADVEHLRAARGDIKVAFPIQHLIPSPRWPLSSVEAGSEKFCKFPASLAGQ